MSAYLNGQLRDAKIHLENGETFPKKSPLLNPAFEPPRGYKEGKAALGGPEKSEVTRPQEDSVRTEAVI